MSAFLDAMVGDPYYTQSVGPQNDGTNLIAAASMMNNPTDAGGGFPASYGQSVLDVFKFGVQTWAGMETQKAAIAARPTAPAGYLPAATGGVSLSTNFILLIVAGLAFVVMTGK